MWFLLYFSFCRVENKPQDKESVATDTEKVENLKMADGKKCSAIDEKIENKENDVKSENEEKKTDKNENEGNKENVQASENEKNVESGKR